MANYAADRVESKSRNQQSCIFFIKVDGRRSNTCTPSPAEAIKLKKLTNMRYRMWLPVYINRHSLTHIRNTVCSWLGSNRDLRIMQSRSVIPLCHKLNWVQNSFYWCWTHSLFNIDSLINHQPLWFLVSISSMIGLLLYEREWNFI